MPWNRSTDRPDRITRVQCHLGSGRLPIRSIPPGPNDLEQFLNLPQPHRRLRPLVRPARLLAQELGLPAVERLLVRRFQPVGSEFSFWYLRVGVSMRYDVLDDDLFHLGVVRRFPSR